jgi:hypothetical protein
MKAKEEKELRLRKRVCNMLLDSSFRLQVAGFNALKEWRNLALLDDEKEKMIGDMRNGLMDNLVKTKERYNREMTRIAFNRLVQANQKIKKMTKTIALFINKNGERQLNAGLIK